MQPLTNQNFEGGASEGEDSQNDRSETNLFALNPGSPEPESGNDNLSKQEAKINNKVVPSSRRVTISPLQLNSSSESMELTNRKPSVSIDADNTLPIVNRSQNSLAVRSHSRRSSTALGANIFRTRTTLR